MPPKTARTSAGRNDFRPSASSISTHVSTLPALREHTPNTRRRRSSSRRGMPPQTCSISSTGVESQRKRAWLPLGIHHRLVRPQQPPRPSPAWRKRAFTTPADRLRPRLEGGRLPVAGAAARRLAGRACAMALPPAVVRLEFRLPPAENTRIGLSNTSVEVQLPLGVSWGHPARAATCHDIQTPSPWGFPWALIYSTALMRSRPTSAWTGPEAIPHGSPALARGGRAQDCRPKPHAQCACVAKDRRAHRLRTPTDSRFQSFNLRL